MKTGKSIQELAQALAHARSASKDFIIPAGKIVAYTRDELGLGSEGIGLALTGLPNGGQNVELNPWTHGQLASFSDIPKQYYERIIRENPALAADSINHGIAIAAAGQDRRMIRTLDGTARALLSPKYRRLDSADLVDAILPTLLDSNLGMQVVSSDFTDRRLYLRATTERLQGEVAKGDVVQAGIMISNSDVGAGALRVEPFFVRLVCLNGMVREHAFKKAHLGRSLAVGDDSIELFQDSTIRLGEQAMWAEVRDVVRACLSKELFDRELAKLKAATQDKITNFDLQKVVEMTCKSIGLTTAKTVQESIVEALASGNQGAGLTRWGLANSLTAAAAGVDDFDLSVELERAGSSVIDMAPGQWKLVSQKAA